MNIAKDYYCVAGFSPRIKYVVAIPCGNKTLNILRQLHSIYDKTRVVLVF